MIYLSFVFCQTHVKNIFCVFFLSDYNLTKQGMRKQMLKVCLAIFLIFGISKNVLAANILTNGGFETGNLNGWSVVNGGNGWAFREDIAHSGKYNIVSSYNWCTVSQEINLTADPLNYTTGYLDSAPAINFSTYMTGIYEGSPYSIKMELRDASHAAIATYSVSGNSPFNQGTWSHFATSVSGYGSGLRYIYIEQKGKDKVGWAGQYGAMFDDAYIQVGGDYTNTLAYTAGTGGTISGSSTQILAFGGDGSTATATPATGYVFSSWSDGITTSARTDKNIVSNSSLTANFSANSYTLVYAAGTGGAISGSSTQIVSAGSNASSVIAIPDTGYSFVSWSDGTTSASRMDLNIASNLNATATFAINTSTISYVAGTGGAISGSSTQVINYGGNASTVLAVPNTGYTFSSWSDGTTSASRADLNITTSSSYTANFSLNNYTLAYVAGTGGTISGSALQTVSYGGSGSAITAVPNYGYSFSSWSDGSSTNPRTDGNVTSSLSLTANFTANATPPQPGTSAQAQANALVALGKINQAKKIQKQFANVVLNEPPKIETPDFGSQANIPAIVNYLLALKAQVSTNQNKNYNSLNVFARDLFTNVEGDDVLALQKYLNNNGYAIAKQGPGSPGNETNTFGALTRRALSLFQKDNSISPAQGYFGPKTRKFINGK